MTTQTPTDLRPVRFAHARALSLAWAMIGCPVIALAAAIQANAATHGRAGALILLPLFALPAALAGTASHMLGGSRKLVWATAVMAPIVTLLGVAVALAVFLLTVPDGFFN